MMRPILGTVHLRRCALQAGLLLLVLGLASQGLASEGAESVHHGVSAAQVKDYFWRLLNFSLLVALAVWAVRKANVKKLLTDRQLAVEAALKDAEQARVDAEMMYDEYCRKLEQASQEIEEIAAAIRLEGEREKAQIVAEAAAMAAKIREQAEQTASLEVAKARAELLAEASRLAVELAGQSIRQQIGTDDQNRLVTEYIDKVVAIQ